MRVDIVMPQMGESIAEGTITRWIKKVGDAIEREEPIFEISTDKVDAEIPAPAAGVLVEILGKEGDTVEVNTVVAVIETDSATAAAEPQGAPAAAEDTGSPEAVPTPAPTRSKPASSSTAGRGGVFISPVVRRIAAEHGIDPTGVPGSGSGGRVTKKDILAFIEAGGAAAAPPSPAALATPVTGQTVSPAVTATQSDAPTFAPGQADKRVAMTQMRRIIADHMIDSRRTSAHVQSVFEVDMTRLIGVRARYKQAYLERHGTKLTFMAFFAKAICDALRAWPIVNASIDGTDVVYHRDLNLGIAVALDWGLIVPVIRNADELSIAGLCKRINDLAERARAKKLSPEEVQGGTFTITNPGTFGGLFGLPIINQPQVAILGVGGIQQRPVVINDAIAIRSMMYVSMSYDHRVVDGAAADQFLARVQHTLEHFDESLL